MTTTSITATSDTNFLLSSEPQDVFRSKLENHTFEEIQKILNEMDKTHNLVKSFEKKLNYSQYESEMKKNKKYLQQEIVYHGTNDKLKEQIKKYIAEYETINLYSKIESNKPIVKIFIEKSSRNENISLFIVNINIDITSSWVLWSDKKLTIDTYSAIIRLL